MDIYEGKACSDVNNVFIAMCRALGLETRFVKLKAVNKKGTHTVSEIKVNSLWYTYDVMDKGATPQLGKILKNIEYGN